MRRPSRGLTSKVFITSLPSLTKKSSRLVSSVLRDHITSVDVTTSSQVFIIFYPGIAVTMSSYERLLDNNLFQDDDSLDNVTEKPSIPLSHRHHSYRQWFLPLCLHLTLIFSYSAIFVAFIHSYSASRSHGPNLSYSKYLP